MTAQSSAVFHRSARKVPPQAAFGEGCWIVDSQGRRYLDACGGAAVSCIGHGHPAVIEAITRQASELAYAHTGFFTTEAAERLADLLVADAPEGLTRAYLVSSGSEAMEAAIKMAHQYHREIGQPGRRHVIARWQSYHGNTLGALSAGGNRQRRAFFADVLSDMHHIAPCYAYRGQLSNEDAATYGRRMANELENAILTLGPETVSAFVAETVVGATLGAAEPAPGYFRRIREICDRYGVLLLLDEVMCGMGRTGTMHACHAEGIAPDIMTVAKGLGAGYLPLGAVLASEQIHQAFREGSGVFQHGHTFVGHPVACAAALAVQTIIREEDLVARCAAQGKKLRVMLHERFADHPAVGDIRGRGLLQAMEFVSDRRSKTPFDPGLNIAARLKARAQDLGLLCYPNSGTVDGLRGDHVLLAPAFTILDEELSLLAELLGNAVDDVVTETRV